MSSPVPIGKPTLVYLGRTNEWDWRVNYVPTAVESMSSPFRSYDTHRYEFFHWFEEQDRPSFISISNTGTMPILMTVFEFISSSKDHMGNDIFMEEELSYYRTKPAVLPKPEDHESLYGSIDPNVYKEGPYPPRYLMPGVTAVFQLPFSYLAPCVHIEAEGFPKRVFILPLPSYLR